jgi:hypothetical protein
LAAECEGPGAGRAPQRHFSLAAGGGRSVAARTAGSPAHGGRPRPPPHGGNRGATGPGGRAPGASTWTGRRGPHPSGKSERRECPSSPELTNPPGTYHWQASTAWRTSTPACTCRSRGRNGFRRTAWRPGGGTGGVLDPAAAVPDQVALPEVLLTEDLRQRLPQRTTTRISANRRAEVEDS